MRWRRQWRLGDWNALPRRIAGESNVLAAIKACARSGELLAGMRIHADAILLRPGRDLAMPVANALVDMYAKCGSTVDARGVFDRMPCWDVVSWTAIIMGYAQRQGTIDGFEVELGLELFSRMRDEGVDPDARTFVAAFKACAIMAKSESAQWIQGKIVKNTSLEKGISLHAQLMKKDRMDVFLASSLVECYGKCGSLLDARAVFDRTELSDTVLWTAMILVYTENGEEELALELFERMEEHGVAANSRTFVAALCSCTSLAMEEEGEVFGGISIKARSLGRGMALHSRLARLGFELDVFVGSSLVDFYAKCGSVEDARRVFERMKSHDVVSWTGMISGYAHCCDGQLALDFFDEMLQQRCQPNNLTFVAALNACSRLAEEEEARKADGKLVKVASLEKGRALHSLLKIYDCELDLFLGSSLVDMYAKCGSMIDARQVFDSVVTPDSALWSSMIFGYAHNGEETVALELFATMQEKEKLQPSPRAFVAALKACGSLVDIDVGKTIHDHIRSAELENHPNVASALVVFYGKCGSMNEAWRIFIERRDRKKDLVVWNALIAGYSRACDTARVLELFEMMLEDRVRPNGVTFLSILVACSHSGMVDEARKFFRAMMAEFGVSPSIEHYGCLVDVLGRSGFVGEALDVVRAMPMDPNRTIWKTLLGAASKWKHVRVAQEAFTALSARSERDAAAFDLMAATYAAPIQDVAIRGI